MVFDAVTWGMCVVSGLTLAVHAWTLKRWARGWKLAAKATSPVEAPAQADFGIVIPCRNEEDRLPHLLDDLVVALRTHPALSQLPVVVVDDWSDDQTASLACRHALQPHVVSMQDHSSTPNEGGKKAALLAGLDVLDTTWAVTLDADVRLQPSWGEAWLHALASQPERCAAVAGPVRLWDGRDGGRFGQVLALDYAAQMGWSAAQIAHGRPASASGANLAVRRTAYPDTRHLGPSGDDALVLQTLSSSGWHVEWMGDPRGTVSTPAPRTWRQGRATTTSLGRQSRALPPPRETNRPLGGVDRGLPLDLAGVRPPQPSRMGHHAGGRILAGIDRTQRGLCRPSRQVVRPAAKSMALAGTRVLATDSSAALGVGPTGLLKPFGINPNQLGKAELAPREPFHVASVGRLGRLVDSALGLHCLGGESHPARRFKTRQRPALGAWPLVARCRVGGRSGETHTAWLGTDQFGRDMLSRIMAGSGISLSVGAGAVLISLILGLLLGGVAGYFGGWADRLISWFLQVMWSVPTFLMVLAITLAFGKGFWQVFLAIGLTMWVEVARIVRGQFLTLREETYVRAAEALGLSSWRVMWRHMLPNALGPLVVVCAANFAAAILIEAGLSFLGVGAQIPIPSWGNIVKEHAHLLTTPHAWAALVPGGLIASLVLAFTWVGDGLRHATHTILQCNLAAMTLSPDSPIYVAGHTGMVGSALVRALRTAGHRNVVVRSSAELDSA